jgi:hypothetical protein
MPSQSRFDETEHRYYWGDKELSGVTSVLHKTLGKPALGQWAANERLRRIAAGRLASRRLRRRWHCIRACTGRGR